MEAFVNQHTCTTNTISSTKEAPQFLNFTIENSKFKIISILHTRHHTKESIAGIVHFEESQETIQSNTSPKKRNKNSTHLKQIDI